MPAAGQPFIVSSTWVVRCPIEVPFVWRSGAATRRALRLRHRKCIHFGAQCKHPSPMTRQPPRPAGDRLRRRDARRGARAARRSGRRPAPTPRSASSSRSPTAIVERRLMPGTKLAEQKIADIFKVSRTLVRQALNQLSRDRLVTLEPARGAFVAEPSVRRGAPGLRGARRCSKAAMVQRLCARDHRRADRRAARAPEGRAGGGGAHRRVRPHAAAGRLPRRAGAHARQRGAGASCWATCCRARR